MSLSKEKGGNAFERYLSAYLRLLQERPVLTKSVTNAVVASLGNVISQLIAPDPAAKGRIVWRSTLAYALFGFFFNGPVIHNFYIYLDRFVPKSGGSSSNLKRLLFDRFVFTPPYLAIFMYVISILEGHGSAVAIQKIKSMYWMILKMNWKIWTVIQYININYVPIQFRVLFMNAVALVWTVYIAIQRRKMAA